MDTNSPIGYSRRFEGDVAELAAFSQALVLLHSASVQVVRYTGDIETLVRVSRKDKVWIVEASLNVLKEQPEEEPSNELSSDVIWKMPDVKETA